MQIRPNQEIQNGNHGHEGFQIEKNTVSLVVKEKVAELAHLPLQAQQVRKVLQEANPHEEFMYLKTSAYANTLNSQRGNLVPVNPYKKLSN